jgi:isoamylase
VQHPTPLGATPDADGTRFALTCAVADRVELCLFDRDGREERVPAPHRSGDVWHVHVSGVHPGHRYGWRVHGPWDPAAGHRCNPHKLLLDPYARAVTGPIRWDPRLVGHHDGAYLVRDDRDSAPVAPRSIVVGPGFDWRGDRAPGTPLDRTVIYEAHVKGLTRLHPAVRPELRGTWGGVSHPAVIEHLQRLGVTAIELLPVQAAAHGRGLVQQGLSSYWGYSTVAFFAPSPDYTADREPGAAPAEFKAMVRELHAAGIEVLLDVVYNHTGEGDHDGATWCFKGVDNAACYRLAEDRTRYRDFTGTGNTVDVRAPAMLQLILDSLRYWVDEMHVDGFRFDLAPALLRGSPDISSEGPAAPLLRAMDADPVLRRVKRIAEPWDLGPDGYQAGRFPRGWSEWNDRFRDHVRDYWRGRDRTLGDLARRLTGSADRFGDGRPPTASVNYVTSHDGFTLRDLVSYERKHNLANGERNRDGSDDNRSMNFGVEGPTDDPAIVAARARQQRNLFATLLLSAGVPLITAGDEIGRTQQGNNNAYCQDNEVSWLDWAGADPVMLQFCRQVGALRREHRVLRRPDWLVDDPAQAAWFDARGERMSIAAWEDPGGRVLGLLLSAPAPFASLFLAFSAHDAPVAFTMPPEVWGERWAVEVDTAAPLDISSTLDLRPVRSAGETFVMAARSLVVLRLRQP